MRYTPYVGVLGMMRKGMAASRVKPAICDSPAAGNSRAARRLRKKKGHRRAPTCGDDALEAWEVY